MQTTLTLGQIFVLGGVVAVCAWSVGQLTASVGMRHSFRYSSASCIYDAMDGARRIGRGGSVVALVAAVAVLVWMLQLAGIRVL